MSRTAKQKFCFSKRRARYFTFCVAAIFNICLLYYYVAQRKFASKKRENEFGAVNK